MSEHPLVKSEELVSEERLTELARKVTCGECRSEPYCTRKMKGCYVREAGKRLARAVLTELNISAIIPYTAGPCHRGFDKHPYDKCPDLEAEGCPYITLPGCFFQRGAVLIRKPASRDEDRSFQKST